MEKGGDLEMIELEDNNDDGKVIGDTSGYFTVKYKILKGK